MNPSIRVSIPHFRSNSDTKTPIAIIHQFLIFCTVAAPLPFFLYNSSRLVNERRSGLKELMKIVGVTLNEVRLSHVMATAVLSTIYASLITMMLKATSTPILPRSNSFIIAWTIILHFMNVTSLAFVTTALSQDYHHANGLALAVYIVSCVLCKIWYNTCHKTVQVYLVSWFLPHAPVYLFWDEVKYLEYIGIGASFGGIATQHTPTCVPVLLSWTVFVVQQVFIMTLAWYLDMVNPGSYGVAQKWNFLFKKQYWTKKRTVTFHVTVEQTRRVLRDDRFFEKGPINAPIVIKLTKVTKIYGGGFRQQKVVALDKVSLDVYEGEITVVLGINGAGKTTLTSVVTGMTAATKGKVYVNGFDNTARIREIRKNLGLCPQQNLTFDYLTVRENIILFERLRGPKCEARASAENLIKKLHLEDKADLFSYQLSTSGERCLQVACALAGGADVLVLDEPTSNCDAETRSDLWDVILVLRGDKTVLMTTTSIEEADALGDRIALLSHGKLKCYGTPLFLKNAIGTGFNLSVTLKHKRNMSTVRQVIGESLPEAVTTKIDHKRILFTLPAKDHELFPKLFDTLEERREELGISAMGVGMSLEEMFLGFIDEEEDDDPLFVKAFQDVERLKGWALHLQQLKVLIRRNFFHMWSFKYQFIILQVMVPVFGLIVITVTMNSSSIRESMPEIEINQVNTLLLNVGAGRSDDLDRFRWAHPGVKIVRSHKVSNDFANYAYTHDNSLLQNVIGINMRDNHSSIYFPVDSLNDASMAINMFSNFYMFSQMPGQYSPIRTRTVNPQQVKLFIPKENILCLLWAMWVTITAVFMAQLIFLPAFLLQLYVLSFFLNEESAMSQIYIMSIALGFSGPLIQILLVHLSEESNSYVYWMDFFTFVGRLSPVFTLSELIAKFASTARVKAYCDKNDRYCDHLISDDYSSVTLRRICCGPNKETFGYFSSFDSFPEIFTLICHSLLYSIILIAVQNRYIQNILGRMLNITYKEKTRVYRDLNVYHEKANVKRMMTCIRSPKHCIGDKPSGRILLVDDLHKNFVNLCQTTPINAVHGVSFSVKGGESIGLLGPPGSGKTSALSMIAGRQSITRGDCCLDGWFLRMQRSQYIAKVSLVKCTGGLDEFYTGYENLKILCLLRGYSECQADTFTINCMAYMGLQHLTHTSVRRYSAGCARLLRLCAALLAAPPAVLLDEPMRSVDPHSRPLVARALARLTGRGSAVVLAEQSLNWRDIDTLCSRIAVFTNGQISALGSSRHVRAMLANGHTARLKLKLKPIRTSISEDSTSDIFSNDDEAADDAEAIKKLKEKRRLEIAAAMKHFNDPDDIEFDNNDKKSDSGKSTQHDDRRESSSQQAARDERRLYLTSRQGSEITETEDEDIEDIKKVYQKSQHNFVKIQLDDDDDDEDNSQPDNANPDKAQTTAEELEISRTGNVPKEGESDQAKTSQPVSAQLSNVESKIDQPVTSRAVAKSIYSNKDQSRGLEGQQSMDELKILLIRDETELAEPLLIRDDSNVRFLRDNNLKGTVYDDITRETMKRNVISLRSVQALKTDFKNEFPTSKLADEHLSMLHFHIKGDKNMTYSSMFSKLEKLKRKYENIIEDYTLSEISIDDVHSLLAKETM
ncbi:phospholipid-transporting ATPase ABCA3-like isoform X2 [Choristoneura fumiferana]|uniref:phospholipid-transporting ATPase ABCA3-like isoform X2 n=1 Tax=Choristoneura fumiferana TaxID=7141 RepID=UPI003D15966F